MSSEPASQETDRLTGPPAGEKGLCERHGQISVGLTQRGGGACWRRLARVGG